MAYLILEDESVFEGEYFGSKQAPVLGEVVFNTGMTGYQELLTDPSYCGQIVVLTYPLIGNIGINDLDVQSGRVQVRGLIVSELCMEPSNWMASDTLDHYLKKYEICGMYGIDTRMLTRKLRDQGTMRGMICDTPADVEEIKKFMIKDPVRQVTCKESYRIPGDGRRVALVDFGMKGGIAKSLSDRGCDITVFPASATAQEILASGCEGIVLSNGPGDPKDNVEIIQNIKNLLGKKPVMGICLGYQLMALAAGADTQKLRFGHRGNNHPVKDMETGRVYITSQNHGYAVVASTLPKDVAATHYNWNDQTIEGIHFKNIPAFGIQFHPEASPGPHDTAYLFDKFTRLMEENPNA